MKRKKMKKLAVLVSGAGSTLNNLCKHIQEGKLDAEISLVIGNNDKAAQIMRNWHLTFLLFRQIDADANEAIFSVCRRGGIDLVVMAGWNRLLLIPDDFKKKVVNIHPSLLPKYGGKGFYNLRVHEAVLAAGEKESGCTVHLADNEYDHGPILAQETVPVKETDTALTLQQRIQEVERLLYPRVIQEYLHETPPRSSHEGFGGPPYSQDQEEARSHFS
jgi:phosphoribosylglycinamide formyltransferase 1